MGEDKKAHNQRRDCTCVEILALLSPNKTILPNNLTRTIGHSKGNELLARPHDGAVVA